VNFAAASTIDRDNPFATRHTRPGALPYLWPDSPCARAIGDSGDETQVAADSLIARLESLNWQGAIIGPHGSGKSTLLAALLPRLAAAGREPLPVTLHAAGRRLPPEFLQAAWAALRPSVLVVDGYEQLGWWARWQLRRVCRRRGHGLLVTAHHRGRLPVLHNTTTSVELALRLVGRLSAACGGEVPADVVAASFERHGGNLREVLMDLYDYDEARRAPPDA